MKAFAKNRYNFALVLIIFTLIVLGCDGSASSKGKILDEQGNPVSDAYISLEVDNGKDKFETRSDKNGSYSLGGVVAPFNLKTKLTVIKVGYQVSQEDFDSQTELKGIHDVILKKDNY